jgi:hypothetical protein
LLEYVFFFEQINDLQFIRYNNKCEYHLTSRQQKFGYLSLKLCKLDVDDEQYAHTDQNFYHFLKRLFNDLIIVYKINY